MKSSPAFSNLTLAAALAAILFSPSPSNAHGHGRRVVVVRERRGPDHVTVVVHGHHYFYRHGCFYRRGHGGYFWVAPPMGAVVTVLPVGVVRVHRGSAFFFYYGGIYYRQAPEGYVVVEKPDIVYVEKKEKDAGDEKVFVEPHTKTVMVENSNDSKTPVQLEEIDGKWKGPKGEYYDAFPTDEQLREAYGF